MLTIQKLPLCSKGAPVAITLENRSHMRVTLLSYGATLQSIVVPDQNGVPTDVLLGYETVMEYEENDGYLGACIGRNGNRIAGAAFTLNGQRFGLTANEGKNQLHGGLCGFDKKLWNYNCRENSVEFTTVLADGEEGYPGRLDVSITFTLTDDNALRIDYRAVSSADTIRMIGPMTSKPARPVSREPVASCHLLTKPPVGGIPIKPREAIVQHHVVIGISLPMPRRSRT